MNNLKFLYLFKLKKLRNEDYTNLQDSTNKYVSNSLNVKYIVMKPKSIKE